MLTGEGLSFYLLPPTQVYRKDNEPVMIRTESKALADFAVIVRRELRSLLAIRQEKR
jgi:hypothetical protein